MTDQTLSNNRDKRTGNNVMSTAMRDYRKGNWTITETMVLIEAKKMDEERRSVNRSPGTGGKASMEPRWKWVEDFCWQKGCYRSQNQCNDKWDNLMRDYKKVRDHEWRRTGDGGGGSSSSSSYWKMEKTDRKDRSLPANMIPQIYDALVDVVERMGVGVSGGGKGGGSAATPVTSQLMLTGIPGNAVTLQPATLPYPLPPQQQKHFIPAPSLVPAPVPTALPLPSGLPPPLPREAAVEPPQSAFTTAHLPLSTRETPEDTSEGHSDTPSKRRRMAGGGRGDSSTSEARDVGTAISMSATIIAEAIQASSEREERRHRDMVCLHERRLKIEESRNEISRQGINDLVDAINRLAASVVALVASSSSSAGKSNNNNNQPPP